MSKDELLKKIAILLNEFDKDSNGEFINDVYCDITILENGLSYDYFYDGVEFDPKEI